MSLLGMNNKQSFIVFDNENRKTCAIEQEEAILNHSKDLNTCLVVLL